jgi:3-oxoacyl-[acyl-carrier-protein] synthase-3
MTSIGILGLGTYLPPIVRGNDWWPDAIVDSWRARQAKRFTHITDLATLGPGAQLVAEATARYADNPFEGARERRVAPADMRSSDMGAAAASDALARANIGPGDIDFLLVQSTCPDYINTPEGCRIHSLLGLRPGCFTTSVDAACAGFLQCLTLAQGLIASGVAKRGLIVQCTPMSRILRQEDPWSAAFGDAATAAIVGEVREGYGLLAQAHATDGATYGGLVTGVPGASWYDDGPVSVHVANHEHAREMVMSIPDVVKGLIEATLRTAGVAKPDVNFLAAHQATDWFGEVIQEHAGLVNARRVNTFPWTTSLSGANLPFALAVAERENLIGDGDLTVMFSGATGMTVGAMVCRWGGRLVG